MSGSPPFVRQVLDDLPGLLAKLRGETAFQPAAIRMPQPAAIAPTSSVPDGPQPRVMEEPHRNGSIDERVVSILRESRRPLAVAAIRKRLGSDVTPQQVRRALERAGDRISATDQRPATYRITGS